MQKKWRLRITITWNACGSSANRDFYAVETQPTRQPRGGGTASQHRGKKTRLVGNTTRQDSNQPKKKIMARFLANRPPATLGPQPWVTASCFARQDFGALSATFASARTPQTNNSRAKNAGLPPHTSIVFSDDAAVHPRHPPPLWSPNPIRRCITCSSKGGARRAGLLGSSQELTHLFFSVVVSRNQKCKEGTKSQKSNTRTCID